MAFVSYLCLFHWPNHPLLHSLWVMKADIFILFLTFREKHSVFLPLRMVLAEDFYKCCLSSWWISLLFLFFFFNHGAMLNVVKCFFGLNSVIVWLYFNLPLENGMATHSSILTWKIPWTEQSWQATVHEVTKSQTWLSD